MKNNVAWINKEIALLSFIIFLSFLGLALPISIFPTYFLSNSHLLHAKSFLYCALAAYPFGEFIATPFIANLSDRYGRRPVILVCLFCACIGFLLTALALCYHAYFTIIFLRFFNGIFEGNSSVIYAAVSDRYSQSERKNYFGYINASLSLGYVIGPFLGAILSQQQLFTLFSFGLPFYFSAAFSFLAFILTFLFFRVGPNTPVNVSNIETKKLFPQIIALEPQLVKLIFYGFFITLGVDSIYQFMPIYSLEIGDLSVISMGLVVSLITFSKIFGNLFLIKIIGKKMDEINSLILGACMALCCLSAILFWKKMAVIFGLLPLLGVSIALMITNLLSMVSNKASEQAQGLTISLVMTLRVLGTCCLFIIYSCVSYVKPEFYSLPLFASILFILLGSMMIQKSGRQQ